MSGVMPGFLREALEQTARQVVVDVLRVTRDQIALIEQQLTSGARLGVEDVVGPCGMALQEVGRRELAFRKAAVTLLEDALASDGARS